MPEMLFLVLGEVPEISDQKRLHCHRNLWKKFLPFGERGVLFNPQKLCPGFGS